MIKNAREYQISKAQAARFERALGTSPDSGSDSALAQLERNAFRSQLADLRADLEEYDALESGRLKVFEANDLAELPQALIRARIAAKLSQRELAERLDLKEQQIQRYEATEYASASLARILEVVRALGLKFRHDIVLPSVDVSREALIKRLREFGFDKKFVESKLVLEDDRALAWRSASAAARVLRLPHAHLLTDRPHLDEAAARAAFKLPANASRDKLAAYTMYARYLAERVLAVAPVRPTESLPDRPRQVHEELRSRYGGVSFESALRFVWDHGIPVVPLRDTGAFHGAFWKIDGRGIIVIKQNVPWDARWIIDLLHEYYHALRAQDGADTAVIELAESPYERRESVEERTATAWATAAALGEREDELAQMCVDEADGEIPLLRRSVLRVAEREDVPADVLANYVAHKLARHDQGDWWATATSLQSRGKSPWRAARDMFLERISLHKLDRLDREIFERALLEEE